MYWAPQYLYCQGRQATMTIPHAFPEAYNFGSELGNYISINVINLKSLFEPYI